MKPTVGRIVHYYGKDAYGDNGEGPYAALVTKVHSDTCVNLMVFMAGMTPASSVQGGDDQQSGMSQRWEWPPRDA